MRFPTLFRQKAAPERSIADAPVQPDVFYLNSETGVAILRADDYVSMENALRHPIIYRALQKIAEAVQQVRWITEVDPYAPASDRAGKSRVITEIQSLLDHPNPDLTAAQLRYWLALNYAGYGRVAFKLAFSAVHPERATGIYPLESKLVQVKLNERGIVSAYIYGLGVEAKEWPSRVTWKPGAKDGFVGQIWKPGLKGYQNRDDVISPLRAIGLPADVIKHLLIRAIKSASGHPNVRYMVTCSKTLTAPQLEALKKHLAADSVSGGVGSGSVPVLQNAGDIEIHKLDNDLSDIHSKVPSDDMARLIFGAFGIPLAVSGIGASDAAKFTGNFGDSRLSFWQDTVLPAYIEPIFQGLSALLCPPGVRIVADVDSIPTMVEARINAMRSISFVSFLTTNEKRQLFGWKATTELPASPFNTGAAQGAASGETDESGAPNQENANDQQTAV